MCRFLFACRRIAYVCLSLGDAFDVGPMASKRRVACGLCLRRGKGGKGKGGTRGKV